MISIIIYRLFFSSGRHKTLYVLVMAAYYTVFFLFVSSSVTTLAGLEADADADGPLPVDVESPSAVTTDALRRRDVVDRWSLRARLFNKHCRGEKRRTRGSSVQGTLVSRRVRMASCAAADTEDGFWLRTFTRLELERPGYRCHRDTNGFTDCELEARRLGALQDLDVVRSEPGWIHVLTVQHPFIRLASAFLHEPWPSNKSTFSEAVDAVTSGKRRLPHQAAPVTSVCDLCGHKHLVIIQKEMEEEELDELGQQLGMVGYLRSSPQNPHSPGRAVAAAAAEQQPAAQLLRQLTAEQVRLLTELYRNDFSALPFYRPEEMTDRRAGHDSL